eukprot:192334-Pyramimonas_sp.AAC.1
MHLRPEGRRPPRPVPPLGPSTVDLSHRLHIKSSRSHVDINGGGLDSRLSFSLLGGTGCDTSWKSSFYH